MTRTFKNRSGWPIKSETAIAGVTWRDEVDELLKSALYNVALTIAELEENHRDLVERVNTLEGLDRGARLRTVSDLQRRIRALEAANNDMQEHIEELTGGDRQGIKEAIERHGKGAPGTTDKVKRDKSGRCLQCGQVHD